MQRYSFVIHRLATGHDYELVTAISVGRRDDCEIRLSDSDASRSHARLTVEDNVPWLEDLNSANGTFVNEQRITGRQRLELGDSLKFVQEEFELRGKSTDDGADWIVNKRNRRSAETVFRGAEPKSRDSDSAADMLVEQPSLLVRSGPEKGSTIALVAHAGAETKWTIGTGADRDVRLSELGVSAFHATLSTNGRRWKLVDEMSVSGTTVNNQPVTVRYLNHKDRISIGPVQCLFMLPEGKARRADAGTHRERRRRGLVVVVAIAALVGAAAAAVVFVLRWWH
jgi:pSer/pThr/pTyr-binding forkhead associated (FHA) protein